MDKDRSTNTFLAEKVCHDLLNQDFNDDAGATLDREWR